MTKKTLRHFVLCLSALLMLTVGSAFAAPVKSRAKVSVAKKTVKASAKKKIDYNAQGLVAFNKSNYVDARRLFDLAMKSDARNAQPWLNQARTIVASNGARDPDDYCDFSKNWIFDALSYLTRAMELNAAKTVPVLKSLSDPNFRKFRERIEYKKWVLLQKLPLKTDLATQEFFEKNNEWLIPQQPMPATVVTFAPDQVLTLAAADGTRETGTWAASADRVSISIRSRVETLSLTATKFIYAGGTKNFQQVSLRDAKGSKPWVLGPEVADCPNP